MSAIGALFGHHKFEFLAGQERRLQEVFAGVSASEGTIWLLDEARQALVPVWNSGPHAADFVGKHRQPVESGLIGLVCATEQAICENAVYRHAGQDPTLDRTLGLLTCAMIAVPFRIQGELRGVVSCVKLKKADSTEPDPPPFTPADLAAVTSAVRRMEGGLDDGQTTGESQVRRMEEPQIDTDLHG